MELKKRAARILIVALILAISIGSGINARTYWVDEVNLECTVSMSRDIKLTVSGLSSFEANANLAEEATIEDTEPDSVYDLPELSVDTGEEGNELEVFESGGMEEEALTVTINESSADGDI